MIGDMMTKAAMFPIERIRFAAIDFETTGLYPNSDRIIECGAVRFSVSELGDRFEQLLDPGMRINPAASRVNGITDSMLVGMPSEKKIIPEMVEFIGPRIIVAHNAGFDMDFLRAALNRLGYPALEFGVIDTLKLARAVFPGRKVYNLGSLATDFSIPLENAHRACDDAATCAMLLQIIIRALREKGEDHLHEQLFRGMSDRVLQAALIPEAVQGDLFG